MPDAPPTTGLVKLRAPFPPELVGHLPRLWCKACTKSTAGCCAEHRKARCAKCKGNVSTAHVDLEYVGHAAVTDRLLDADARWSWEPLASDERGLPAFDEHGGLWIRLTVCGHTRLGYGDAQGKAGPNAIKEAIGDALRNAAMRFGAGLDLWSKADLRAFWADQGQAQPSTEESTPGLTPGSIAARIQAALGNAEALQKLLAELEEHDQGEVLIPSRRGNRRAADIITDLLEAATVDVAVVS